MKVSQKHFNILSWKLFALAVILPLLTWLQSLNWGLDHINVYRFFPLLGMVAWLVMAVHFMVGALRIKQPTLVRPKYFKPVTGYVVLACILLHPGLLMFGLNRDFDKTLPGSLYSFVGQTGQTAVRLGMVALLVFLSFEFFDRMRKKAWVIRNWRWIDLSQMLAMILIFVHALRLGDHVQEGWFKFVWFGVGLILLPCFYIILRHDFKRKANA